MQERQQRKKQRIQEKQRRKERYDRVYALHAQAEFICYINDVYMEKYQGADFVKLEGLVAKGTGRTGDVYQLFSCNGVKKADITMEELYLGTGKVDKLEGGDKRAALYPKEQDVPYKAGDILCKLEEEGKCGAFF